jgi:hypothetical protein
MQFWVLEDVGLGPDHDRWWRLVLSKRSEKVGESNWWEVFRGNLPPPNEPAPFRVFEGREQGDVMYTDLLGLSFSARMTELLMSVGCTGFAPNPSIIYDKRDRETVCTDARWTQFQQGCGPVDRERGHDPLRPFTRRDAIGLFFDQSTWTGLDMFKPPKCAQVVVTDRIATAIQCADLRGYTLVRTAEYGRDMAVALQGLGRRPAQSIASLQKDSERAGPDK